MNKEKKKKANHLLIVIACCIFALLVVELVMIVLGGNATISLRISPPSTPTATIEITPTPTFTPSPTPAPTFTPEPTSPYTDIVVGFAGDIMAHYSILDSVFKRGDTDNTYDFKPIFEYIKPALEYPDLMIANLESPVAGKDAGYTDSFYYFNFPDEIITALQYAGIDAVLNGNNHVFDKLIEGTYSTIDALDATGMLHTGLWTSPEDRLVPFVIDIQGIKIGIISATYSLNGYEVRIPSDVLEYLVCYIDEAQVEKEIALCREFGADIVIVSPHMGDEYQQATRSGFRKYANAYIKMGADIIIAHHPHVLQPIEKISVTLDDGSIKEGYCFYSIGNFMSNMFNIEKETGIIVYLNITKDNVSGETTIKSIDYLPIWMLRRTDFNPRKYAVLSAGNTTDFSDPSYDCLELSRSNFRHLEAAWKLATRIIGDEYATPLSDIPTR